MCLQTKDAGWEIPKTAKVNLIPLPVWPTMFPLKIRKTARVKRELQVVVQGWMLERRLLGLISTTRKWALWMLVAEMNMMFVLPQIFEMSLLYQVYPIG